MGRITAEFVAEKEALLAEKKAKKAAKKGK